MGPRGLDPAFRALGLLTLFLEFSRLIVGRSGGLALAQQNHLSAASRRGHSSELHRPLRWRNDFMVACIRASFRPSRRDFGTTANQILRAGSNPKHHPNSSNAALRHEGAKPGDLARTELQTYTMPLLNLKPEGLGYRFSDSTHTTTAPCLATQRSQESVVHLTCLFAIAWFPFFRKRPESQHESTRLRLRVHRL